MPGPGCPASCGVPDQGPDPCALPWQVDSEPPGGQRSPDTSELAVSLSTVHGPGAQGVQTDWVLAFGTESRLLQGQVRRPMARVQKT